MRSNTDIDPEAMSKATLVYLKKRPVNSESQGSQPDPQCHNSMGAVAAERKRTDPIARYADPITVYRSRCHISQIPQFPDRGSEGWDRGKSLGCDHAIAKGFRKVKRQ